MGGRGGTWLVTSLIVPPLFTKMAGVSGFEEKYAKDPSEKSRMTAFRALFLLRMSTLLRWRHITQLPWQMRWLCDDKAVGPS